MVRHRRARSTRSRRRDCRTADAIEAVARLYPASNSAEVQNAIAGVLIRADYSGLDRVELAQTLRQYRVKSRGSDDLVDALIRRLEIH